MLYKYKEYNHIFDTPAKKEQERVIVLKIMELLNKNKYDNIEEFIQKNQTYQDFLKNNELENVIKHFGNTLNEDDFKKIQNEMVKLTQMKKSFDKEKIKTTNIDNKQYNSYESKEKTFFFDNSNSNMSIERQMEELQKTQTSFQTADQEKNAENLMRELENRKKESLNLRYLHEIDINSLSFEQAEIFSIVKSRELLNQSPLRLDIDKGIIVDESNNIMKIEKTDNGIIIREGKIQKNNNNEKSKINKEKTLIKRPNTIYSN